MVGMVLFDGLHDLLDALRRQQNLRGGESNGEIHAARKAVGVRQGQHAQGHFAASPGVAEPVALLRHIDDQVAVREHDPLWCVGCTGGVEQCRQVIRVDLAIDQAGRVAVQQALEGILRPFLPLGSDMLYGRRRRAIAAGLRRCRRREQWLRRG